MTDQVKTKLKSITKDIVSRIEELESQYAHVREGLAELLNEDDVKDLPSYEMLHSIYSEYLTDKPIINTKVKSSVVSQIDYDPLYAPKDKRRLNAIAKKKYEQSKQQISQTTVVSEKTQPDFSSSYSPDFGENLLDDIPSKPQKSKPTRSSKPSKPQKIVVATEPVFKVTLMEEEYLRYKGDIYDKDTHLKVGYITDNKFNIGSKQIEITETTTITELKTNEKHKLFKGRDGKVYMNVTNNVYQSIGEISDDGSVGLWITF